MLYFLIKYRVNGNLLNQYFQNFFVINFLRILDSDLELAPIILGYLQYYKDFLQVNVTLETS